MSTTAPTSATPPTARPPRAARPPLASSRRTTTIAARVDTVVTAALDTTARFLTRWSVPALRVALGLVFLGFGALKLVPGASPAESIAARTVETLTFGLVGGTAAVIFTALLEVFIGLTLVTGRLLKSGLLALAVAMAGILSPLVLFAGELFGDGVTLLGQYVLKDLVLVTGASVVAAVALGARLKRDA
jgi:putative oxidoreductase